MKRRFLALLIASAVFVTAFLSGCGAEEKEKGTDASPGTSTAASADNASSQASAPAELEPIEVTVAYGSFDEFDIQKDEVAKRIYDKTKVIMKPITSSTASQVEQLKLWGASATLPDIMLTYTIDTDIIRYYQWIDQGLLRDIPENLISKYPQIKKIFDENTVANAVKDIKGKYYHIPRPESLKGYLKSSFVATYYRKDWMKNVGINEEPKTVDEFYEMLKKFTTGDPDGNKKNDTFGLTMPKLNMDAFAIHGIMPISWKEKDGQWVPSWTLKETAEALKWFRKLYQEKILDPEFAQTTWQMALQKMAKNQCGVMFRNQSDYWVDKTINQEFGGANPQIARPLDAMGLMGPIKKDANTPAVWPAYFAPGGTEVSANVSDEKLDRILNLYEYLVSDEARAYVRYGIEGQTYKKNGDTIEFLKDPNGKLYMKETPLKSLYPCVPIVNMPAWDADGEIEGPVYSADVKAESAKFREAFGAVADKENLVPRIMSTPVKDILTITDQTVIDKFTEIIVSTDDVDQMFNDFVNDAMKNKGLEIAIQQVNEKMKSLK